MSERKLEKGLNRRDFIKGAAVGAGAIALAGFGLKEAKAGSPPKKWDYEADLVIVGSGGGGITAAITAADARATFLVLEKAPEEHMGGNTACTGAFCIGATVESGIEYLRSMCWGTVPDEEVIVEHVKAVHELPGWIKELGGKTFPFGLGTTYPLLPGGKEWGGTAGQASGFLMVEKIPDIWDTFKFFKDCAAARGLSVEAGTLKYKTPVTELIQDPNTKEILGVKALEGVTFADYIHYTGGKEIYVKAKKAVILACGGYENNEEIRRNFAPHPHSAFTTFYGTPYNTGDGVLMAQSVGAKLWHMNKKECHSFACAVGSKEIGAGLVVEAYGAKMPLLGPAGPTGSLIANRDGKRFMSEYFFSGHTDDHKEYDEFEHRHLPQDDYEYSDYRNTPFYWIFDEVLMTRGPLLAMLGDKQFRWAPQHKAYTWSKDNQVELAKGWLFKADTIEELGKKIVIKDFFGKVVGMDAAGLAETVNKYNQYCAAGEDPDFGRRPASLIPLNNPPFYAMEVCECQTNTQGGPEHNKHRQTIGADGKPIPRLYTIGELGSIYGFLYNGGGNIPETYATGRLAAKHALKLE